MRYEQAVTKGVRHRFPLAPGGPFETLRSYLTELLRTALRDSRRATSSGTDWRVRSFLTDAPQGPVGGWLLVARGPEEP